ncbi:hypothetical protein ACVW1A_006962 [Bradyrhizobium sp. LB1.3]
MARMRVGRPPKGGIENKVEAFTTRITAETRRLLESSAKAHGRSLSQEAEVALRSYLEKPSGAPRNRALAYIVGNLAEGIEARTGKNWREDVFTGMAVHSAIEAALVYLVPERQQDPKVPERLQEHAQKMPPEIAQQYLRPGSLGTLRGFHLMTEIESAKPTPGEMLREMDLPISMNASLDMLGMLAADLGLIEAKRKP